MSSNKLAQIASMWEFPCTGNTPGCHIRQGAGSQAYFKGASLRVALPNRASQAVADGRQVSLAIQVRTKSPTRRVLIGAMRKTVLLPGMYRCPHPDRGLSHPIQKQFIYVHGMPIINRPQWVSMLNGQDEKQCTCFKALYVLFSLIKHIQG